MSLVTGGCGLGLVCNPRRGPVEAAGQAVGLAGTDWNDLHASIPTKNQHFSALRCLFDRLVLRHAVDLNRADSVRGEGYQPTEGKTRENTLVRERTLLALIHTEVIAALRDRAIAGRWPRVNGCVTIGVSGVSTCRSKAIRQYRYLMVAEDSSVRCAFSEHQWVSASITRMW